MCPHRLHPCQKQPSTKTARLFAAKKKSGLPGTPFGCMVHPPILARTNAIRRTISVLLLPRLRIADMIWERRGVTLLNRPPGSRDLSMRSTEMMTGKAPSARTRQKTAQRSKHEFISFFSGACGLDIGLEAAGFKCLAVNEVDPVACRTIRKNWPERRVYESDIRQLSAESLCFDLGIRPRELFAIAGGPPCQAFSTAGRRMGLNDERGNVFLHFIDLIAALQPKYAVFENVRGLLSAPLMHRPHDQRGKGFPRLNRYEMPGGALAYILKKLEDSGYSTTFTLYNTANYGVPQARERLVFFASRQGEEIPFIEPTHDEKGLHGRMKWKTLKDAIGGLCGLEHHAAKFPDSRLKFYKLLQSGQNWRNIPSNLQEEAMGGSWNAGGGKTGFYRRLSWDKPSPTLVTRPNMKATDLCHPEELRPLSVEEYAAIQTFPREYIVEGRLDDQYRQIGNAVPCLFGKAIGEHLIAFDEGKLATERRSGKMSRYTGTDHASWKETISQYDAQLSFESMAETFIATGR